MSRFCTEIIQKLQIWENLRLCSYNSRAKQSRWAYMQWKWFISRHPIMAACPSSWLCSEALRNYHDRSPDTQHKPASVTVSLKQYLQLASRWKVLSVQLLPTKQTDRKQINLQETNLERIQTQAFVKVAWQCQQRHRTVTLTSITCSHLQFNTHDFHRSQLFKGKMYSASVLQLLFCFIAFTYSTSSIPSQEKSVLH